MDRTGLTSVRATIAICTFNPNEQSLSRALDAVVSEAAGLDSIEVLVVDNNSSPPLRERPLMSRYAVKIVEEPTPGLTAAREAVFAQARGDLIVFVDDDNVLEPGYVAAALQAFDRDAKLGVLGGSVRAEHERPISGWAAQFEPSLAVRPYPDDFYAETTSPPWSENFPVGAGMVVRRELARAYQDDCATTQRIEGRRGSALSSGEDLDLGLFALSRGYKLAVTGAMQLVHLISVDRLAVPYLSRLAESNVRSSLELERKWAPRLGEPVYPMFSDSIVPLLAKLVVSRFLALRSPRFQIEHRRYRALTRARLGRS